MKPGLYEQIINMEMNSELEQIPADCKHQQKVDSAEASKVLSAYVAELLQRKMDSIYESSGDNALSNQIEYINKVISVVDDESKDQTMVGLSGEQLLSIMSDNDERLLPGRKAKDIARPETSMAFSSLFTGAVIEPQMLNELKKEIASADRILKDLNFGDLWVGSHKLESPEHLFVSIQTLNSKKLYDELPNDYYDFVVVDEFHHAAAPIYKEPLAKLSPKILLGLTATPERMDGEDILQYFNGRIAAEIRLPEAIDRKLLCPFQERCW